MAPTTIHGDTRNAALAHAGLVHGLAYANARPAVAIATHPLPEHATGLGNQSGAADESRLSSNRPSQTTE